VVLEFKKCQMTVYERSEFRQTQGNAWRSSRSQNTSASRPASLPSPSSCSSPSCGSSGAARSGRSGETSIASETLLSRCTWLTCNVQAQSERYQQRCCNSNICVYKSMYITHRRLWNKLQRFGPKFFLMF